jgi:PPOX class probable F420-dependent enzyme
VRSIAAVKLTATEITELLVSTNPAPLATIATVQPDGAPHAVPVWFEWKEEERQLVMTAYAGAAWARNLERDPRTAVVIAQQVPPYATVIARGTVSLARVSKPEIMPILDRLTPRYLPPAQVEPYLQDVLDTELVIVTLVPESFTTWSFEFRATDV